MASNVIEVYLDGLSKKRRHMLEYKCVVSEIEGTHRTAVYLLVSVFVRIYGLTTSWHTRTMEQNDA